VSGEAEARWHSGSEHAPPEANALSPAGSKSPSAAPHARSISGNRSLVLRRSDGARVVLPRAWQDFMREHGEVLSESIVHLPVLLATLTAVVAGEASSPAERAQSAVGVATSQLRLAHGGEDGR
jgi:hypothetical protein